MSVVAGSSSAAANASLAPNGSKDVRLSKEVLSAFRMSKLFGQPLVDTKRGVSSLSFDDRGDYLVSSAPDDTIQVWSCSTGKHVKTLYSKKYGVQLARFTHRNNAIIYASTKEDDTIRYHSLSDNKYLQYFRGHQAKVTSLQMSPVDDTFLSGATNESIRLWDLRTPTCQGLLPVQGHPIIAYDVTGLVFAVCLNERPAILLYSRKEFREQPFLTMNISDDDHWMQKSVPPQIPVITSMSFNARGQLLIGLASDLHYVADTLNPRILYRLRGLDSLAGLQGNQWSPMVPEAGLGGQECGWTPDGRFAYSGSADGRLHFWQIPTTNDSTVGLSTLYPSMSLSGHTGPTTAVAFNPRSAMIASACLPNEKGETDATVAFWLPDADNIDDEDLLGNS